MDAHLGFLLRVAANHITLTLARRLQPHGIGPPDWVALRLILDAGSLSPSRLAEIMATTRGGTSKLVDRLVARGLIARSPGGKDRRGHMLSLTAAGTTFARNVADLAKRNDDAFFAPLEPAERAVLRDLLSRLGQPDQAEDGTPG